MKKYLLYIFIALICSCVGLGIFLIVKNQEVVPSGNETVDVSDETLSVTVLSSINLVVGESTSYAYYVNIESADINFSISDTSVACLDEDMILCALNSGETNCSVTAIYKNQTVTKTTSIIVTSKQITFTEINDENFTEYKSDKKADNSYDTYTLKLNANYSLKNSILNLDDNILIVATNFLDSYKTLIIQYNLLYEGEFSFLIDGFSFSKTATSYISSLELNFVNVSVVNNNVNLFNLTDEKESAYLDGKYDYAQLSGLENFDVVVSDENVIEYNDLIFTVKGNGIATVSFNATDGSGYVLQINFIVSSVSATSCSFNICSEMELTIGETFTIIASDYLPVYATIKNLTFETSTNLTLSEMIITATDAGEGWIKIYLNDVLVIEVTITVNDVQPEEDTYTLCLQVPSGVSVDMENFTISMSAGSYQIRVYIYDENNNMAGVSAQILSGNASASFDGNTLLITCNENAVLRIFNNDNNSYYDFNLIIIS